MLMDKVSKDIEILKTLNLLWEKSIDAEKNEEVIESYLNSSLAITKELLNTVLPEYKELLAKDNLTQEDAWKLIYIKDILDYITYSVSNYQTLAGVLISVAPQIKDILKEIMDLYLYLSDLTGMYPQIDENLQKQIDKSLKEKEEGNIRNIDEVLREI